MKFVNWWTKMLNSIDSVETTDSENHKLSDTQSDNVPKNLMRSSLTVSMILDR